MKREVFSPQLFEAVPDKVLRATPKLTHELLVSWALTTPKPHFILDPAAGYGTDVHSLQLEGINAIGQDGSDSMVAHAVTPIQQRLIEDLSLYDSESFSGILLKDTLAFLSPHQREHFFQNAASILRPNGSVLILSEKFLQHWASDIDGNWEIQTGDIEAWRAYVEQKSPTSREVQFIFRCDPPELTALANSYGFAHKRTIEYDRRDPFVRENQWIQMDYFVSEYIRT